MAGNKRKRTIKSTSDSSSSSILTRVTSAVSESSIYQNSVDKANDTVYIGKRLLKSTGKAAWIAATTAIILVLPLIIEMDRENQLDQMELQASLHGPPSLAPPPVKY